MHFPAPDVAVYLQQRYSPAAFWQQDVPAGQNLSLFGGQRS
jgi:hypothetical protein